MNKKILKDVLLLLGIIIVTAAAARFLAGGETLLQYAQNNPGSTASSSAGSSSDSSSTDSSSNSSSTGSSSDSSSAASIEASLAAVMEPAEPEITQESGVLSSGSSGSTGSDSLAKELSDSSTDTSQQVAETATESNNPERVVYMENFYYEPISNDIFKRISGISYPVDCKVSLDELRYLSMLYVDFDGNTQTGEMIVNKDLAQDVIEIFYELYTNNYQIQSIKLIDEYGGDDNASMMANNTSSFNYRVVEGTTRLSNHATGRAIDLNPFYNPYITYNSDGTQNISPEGSEAYADRSASFPYKIDENDLAYKLFKAHGFTWGGNWNSVKDYQHFQKKE